MVAGPKEGMIVPVLRFPSVPAAWAGRRLGLSGFWGSRARMGDAQDSQPVLDRFYEEWSKASTINGRAAVEQKYLIEFGGVVAGYETELRAALGQTPRQAGRLVDVRDKAVQMAVCLDNLWVNAPVVLAERAAYSPRVGLAWNGPANAISARLNTVEKQAQAELDRMAAEFGVRPWTPTPRVCPTKPPKPGEELPSGETGARPRIPGLDDVLDALRWLLKNWWILAVGAGGYVAYQVVTAAGAAPVIACLRKDGLYDLYPAEGGRKAIERGVRKADLPEGAVKACPAGKRR